MWTIYDHPRDFPDRFVARKWLAESWGPVATDEVMTSTKLETLRQAFASRGLTPLAASPGEDPCIVETWI